MPTHRGLCSTSLWESTCKKQAEKQEFATFGECPICQLVWTPRPSRIPQFPDSIWLMYFIYTAMPDVWEQSILILIYSLNLLCALRSELSFICKWVWIFDGCGLFGGLMWLKSCQSTIRFCLFETKKCDVPKTAVRSFLTKWTILGSF